MQKEYPFIFFVTVNKEILGRLCLKKPYDALIIPIRLTFMSDFFYLYITKQACMRLVFYCSIYGTVPRAHNGTLRFFFFFRRSRES